MKNKSQVPCWFYNLPMENQKYKGVCERIHGGISPSHGFTGKAFFRLPSTNYNLISISKSQAVLRAESLISSSRSKKKSGNVIIM